MLIWDPLDQTGAQGSPSQFTNRGGDIDCEKCRRSGSDHSATWGSPEDVIHVSGRDVRNSQSQKLQRNGRQKIVNSTLVIEIADHPVSEHRVDGASNLRVVLTPDLIKQSCAGQVS
jgi:hypothetical protein